MSLHRKKTIHDFILYIFIEYFYEVYTFDMKTLNGLLLNLNLHYLFEFRLA